MKDKIAHWEGNGWDRNKAIEVFKDEMHTIFEVRDENTLTEVQVRNVSRPEAMIQIQITKYKNGRQYISSFSIPAELSELFITAVSKPHK